MLRFSKPISVLLCDSLCQYFCFTFIYYVSKRFTTLGEYHTCSYLDRVAEIDLAGVPALHKGDESAGVPQVHPVQGRGEGHQGVGQDQSEGVPAMVGGWIRPIRVKPQ